MTRTISGVFVDFRLAFMELILLYRVVPALDLILAEREIPSMKLSHIAPIAAVLAVVALAGCANTIRGMGQDTANTVNATQSAGHRVAKSAN
jgi:entericidin B